MTQSSNRRVPDPNVKLVCKPRVYRSSVGLDFWYNNDCGAVVTNDPTTSIQFLAANRGMDSVMFVYLKIDGMSIQIARKNGEPFPPSVYRGPKYSTTWVIGSLGIPLYRHLLTQGYRSLAEADFNVSNGYEPIAIDSGFSSKKQQDVAMCFIKEALQRYSGEWIGACRGEEQQAEVYFRPELEDQLESGALLL